MDTCGADRHECDEGSELPSDFDEVLLEHEMGKRKLAALWLSAPSNLQRIDCSFTWVTKVKRTKILYDQAQSLC